MLAGVLLHVAMGMELDLIRFRDIAIVVPSSTSSVFERKPNDNIVSKENYEQNVKTMMKIFHYSTIAYKVHPLLLPTM